jgi:catechol 2,3-dioxygenase-like lactoylglutathione lyase family enzyme
MKHSAGAQASNQTTTLFSFQPTEWCSGSGGGRPEIWSRSSLAEDSGVTDSGGFGGITLAYNTRSNEEVDQIVAEAQAAGATVSKAPAETFWGGYSGVFLDLDGHPWEVAHNPHWTLNEDGDITLN